MDTKRLIDMLIGGALALAAYNNLKPVADLVNKIPLVGRPGSGAQ